MRRKERQGPWGRMGWGGREKEVEGRKRKGRGELSLWPSSVGHSGVVKNQERKEMCPGWGTGVHTRRIPHPTGCYCSPLSLGSACIPAVEALALLFWQFGLPSPVQPPSLSCCLCAVASAWVWFPPHSRTRGP